ncbi:DUF3040 domain-containing protein [Microbacterium sp. NPDC091313]
MPLSEQEQRLLDEMERHLMRNEADVVTAPGRALSYRYIVLGTLLVLAGLSSLVLGVVLGMNPWGIVLGVGGFVVMLGGVVLAVTPSRGAPPIATASSAPRATARPGASFMDRLNDRWDRRQEGR